MIEKVQEHSLAGISIRIQGPRSPVTASVMEMFRLTYPAHSAPEVLLNVYDLHGIDSLDRVIPDWLCQEMQRLPPSEDAFMVYGDRGDLATIINSEAALYCAWMSEQGDEIRYVACQITRKMMPLSVSTALVPVLRELVATQGKVLLHAASLCCPDNTGMLIFAESGGGKTTTALAVLRQGGHFLADDLTVLHENRQEVYMTGFPEPLNLTQTTIDFFPELNDALYEPHEQAATGKRLLSAQNVYGDACVADTCGLHVAYFVKVSREGPHVLPVAPDRILGKLIHAHTFAQNQRVPKTSVNHLFSFLSRIRTFELSTGSDPNHLGKWLIENCKYHSGKKDLS